jgi:catechol 2,3-dioxygenase
MIFDPAWKTVVWKGSELDVGAAWTGTPMPDSFWSYGTPLAAEPPANPRKAADD